MTNLPTLPEVSVAKSKIAGLGLFSTHSILSGALIEIAHVIELPDGVSRLLIEHKCSDLFLMWKDIGEEKILAYAIGKMMFCNHSEKPNATIERKTDQRIVRLRATRNIAPGEEITVYYESLDFVERRGS